MSHYTHAIDRLGHVTAYLKAVSDLMNPEPDLHAVNRDKQACCCRFWSPS